MTAGSRVLTVNAGSSSVKLRLLDEIDAIEQSADLAAGSNGFDSAHLNGILREWQRPDLVGHRVVHGGTTFAGPVRISPAVRDELAALTDLAPLHQPKSLAALDAVTEQLPDVPAVASFDTAFHTTIPAAAATYALPAAWRNRYGIRRYGFHGLSHAYGSRRALQMLAGPRPVRGSSPAILAPAPHSQPSSRGAASTRRWASPRSTAWSWRPARAALTLVWCSGSKNTHTWRPMRLPLRWRSTPD